MKFHRVLPVLVMLATAATVAPADQKAQPSKDADKTGIKKADGDAHKGETGARHAALEKEFSQRLSGAALVGAFTTDGQKSDKPPASDRYELEKVSKLYGDHWLFVARIKYGETDLKVPLTLQVLWAGDTPMISLTDLAIPGLGTFTARVMFHGDRYAGTWQHGKSGGHMWGHIEPAKKADEPAKKTEPPTDKDKSTKHE